MNPNLAYSDISVHIPRGWKLSSTFHPNLPNTSSIFSRFSHSEVPRRLPIKWRGHTGHIQEDRTSRSDHLEPLGPLGAL